MLDQLRSGALAAAFTVGVRPPRDLQWQFLRSVCYRVAVPTKLAPQMQRGGWHVLAALPWFDTGVESHPYQMLRDLFEQQGLAPNVVVHSEDTGALDAYVRSASACALLREEVALHGVERGDGMVWGHARVDAQLYFCSSAERVSDPLAVGLSARFRKPWPIVAGILVATLLNHALAGLVGEAVARSLGPDWLRWVIGGSFIAMAGWLLVPDEIGAIEEGPARWGVFATTLVAFFIAEMGDKTQIATVALAARYPDLVAVVGGTTLGMMLANVPAVWLGERIARRLSMPWLRGIGALIFAALGAATLPGWGSLASLFWREPG